NTSNIFKTQPAVTTDFKVIYDGKTSNTLTISAATCCSQIADKVILYQEDFGTLPTQCSRSNTDVVPASPDMQYADNNIFYNQFVNDGYYAVVADPGCYEHGSSSDPWFLSGFDHTGNGNNSDSFGGMLLVNNGLASATIFSKTIKNP